MGMQPQGLSIESFQVSMTNVPGYRTTDGCRTMRESIAHKSRRSHPRRPNKIRLNRSGLSHKPLSTKIVHILIPLLIIILTLNEVNCALTCEPGKFMEYGHCFDCHGSCKECETYGECTQCQEGFTYNDTIKLCDYQDCPLGEFYSVTKGRCDTCEDSCNGLCSYQSQCFECSSGEILNLKNMTCVTECDTSAQILIQDPQLKDIPVCRDFNYFVNANSESPVEVGTQQHPYKDLESAFVEILNYHSHNARNITVYVMEATTVFAKSVTYVVNMTHVQVEAYNENNAELGLARMVGLDNSTKIVAPAMPTKFNILDSKNTLDDELIFNNSGFNTEDKVGLQLESAVFKPFHCGFILKNFRIVTNYDNPATSHAILEPYRADIRTVGMINVDMRMQGTVLFAATVTFNWHMENILVETQNLYRFSLTRLRCGDDQTDLGVKLFFKNVTSINSATKPAYLHISESFARNSIPGDLHFEDCYFDTYLGYDMRVGQFIIYQNTENCDPLEPRHWNFTNVHTTTSRHDEGKDPQFSRTNVFGFLRVAPIEATLNVYLNNVTFSNDSNDWIGRLVPFFAYHTIIHANGLHFINSEGIMMNFMNIDGSAINNISFENCTANTAFMSFINSAGPITFDGVTIKNMTDTGAHLTSLFQNIIYEDANFSLKNLKIEGSKYLNRRAVIFATGTSQSTYLAENIDIKDSVLSGGSTFVSYSIFKEVNITNVSCLRGTILEEGTNFVLKSDYTSEGSSPNNTQTIKNVHIDESTVSIYSVSNPDSQTNVTQSLSISNVTYENSSSDYSFDLFKIFKMSTVGTYTVTIEDVSFSNLTYAKESKLMYLQQQLKSPVVITNLNVSDVIFAGITIEAFESNEIYNKTHVAITNMKASNVDGYSRSLINLYKGADIEIIDSEFSFIGNYAKGAVLSGGRDRAVATFINSSFWNNTSVEGGVFSTESESNVKCYNCTFTNNFAISGGVVKVDADGIFEFYNSTIEKNYALAGAFSELFSSQTESIINNCSVTSNFGLTKDEIATDILPQGYIYQTFRDYLGNNSYLYEYDGLQNCIKMIIGQLVITDTIFRNQQYVLSATGSTISVLNSSFIDIDVSSRLLRISESDILLENTTLSNLTCRTVSDELFYLIKANTEFITLNYSNSTCKLINSGLSQIYLKSATVREVSLTVNPLIVLLNSQRNETNNAGRYIPTSIIASSFVKVSTTGENLIEFKSSKLVDISNTSFVNINSQVLKMDSSAVDNIEEVNFIENKGCISATKSTIELMHSSLFELCGDINTVNGGAMRLINCNTQIHQSEFVKNKAEIGAGLSIECDFGQSCVNNFTNLTFMNNSATQMGGGIYYNLVRPLMQNITYRDNLAEYGANIASYAVRIVQSGTKENKIYLSSVASGLKYDSVLAFDLVDYDDQIMNLESSTSVKILIEDPGISIRGVDFGRLTNGKAELDNVYFIGTAGSSNHTYKLTSKSINSKIISSIIGNSDGKYDNFLDVSFRYCKPGEIQTSNNECVECKVQTYTFEWNSTQCLNCMESATCLGKDEIEVANGYWRKSTNSSKIIKCLNEDACIGGYHPEKNDHPVKCEEGYKGTLCTECDIVDGTKYQPLTNFRCSKCPDPVFNAIRITGVTIAAFMFLMLLIYINLHKKKESEISILLRILTNYLHLISAFFSFNLTLPSSFTNSFSFMNRVSSPDETFFSFDCFINDYEIKLFAPNNALFKLTLYIFFPLIMIAAIFLLFGTIRVCHEMIKYIKREWFDRNVSRGALFDFKRSMIVSMICIIFLFHPTLIVKSLSMFLCTEIDEGDSRMTHHLEYQCYSWDHCKWILIVALPTMAIWVFGFPLFALWILIKNREKLDQPHMQSYFLILYQGFRKETFYWEFISALRKFVILSIHSLLDRFSVVYTILLSCVSLVFFYYLQKKIRPYKLDDNNRIDLVAVTIGIITIYSGIIFSLGDESYKGFYMAAWVVLVWFNAYFVLNWFYLLLLSFECRNDKYLFLVNLLGCILFRKRKNQGDIKRHSVILNSGLRSFAVKTHKKLSKKKKSKKKFSKKKILKRRHKKQIFPRKHHSHKHHPKHHPNLHNHPHKPKSSHQISKSPTYIPSSPSRPEGVWHNDPNLDESADHNMFVLRKVPLGDERLNKVDIIHGVFPPISEEIDPSDGKYTKCKRNYDRKMEILEEAKFDDDY
ncbi:unnamed protein product [Moneuplotes crassus]|uniref:Uncharacterized protein n=1 Tax=Euplotes crassus TaxID=5936 RepID=A0AAD1X861_EUPCR|nr:unnamed protein product [Moneuplotes crassus]